MLEGEGAGDRVAIGDQKAANAIFGFGGGVEEQAEYAKSEESIKEDSKTITNNSFSQYSKQNGDFEEELEYGRN